MKIILFSGRFDRPHLGHLVTIARLGQKFDKVIICILDYKNQYYPIADRVKIMRDATQFLLGNYQVITNGINFEKITKEEVEAVKEKYPFTHYGTGNFQCFNNMKNHGFEVVDVKRYPGYAASDDVKLQKIIKFLEEEWGIK